LLHFTLLHCPRLSPGSAVAAAVTAAVGISRPSWLYPTLFRYHCHRRGFLLLLLWRRRGRPLLVGISRTGWLHPTLFRGRCHPRGFLLVLLWRRRCRPLLVGISRTGWLHPTLLRCRCHRRITLLLLLWRRPLVLGTSRASRLRLT
jgi:hypothetical protein